MCCLLQVIILPVLVTCILYDLLWWLWLSFPIIVPWVHDPPSSCWTTTVDPMGIDTKILEVSLFWSFLPCLCIRFLWCLSSFSIFISFLSIIGILPHTRWLNSNVARLGRPCPSGVVLICTNTMCISPLEAENFFYSVFNEFYVAFYLSIALLVVWWQYCLLDVETVAETFEPFWNEIATSIWH